MSVMQTIALKQGLNARERAILSANSDIADGWVIAAGYFGHDLERVRHDDREHPELDQPGQGGCAPSLPLAARC
jgi:hypothetical protein